MAKKAGFQNELSVTHIGGKWWRTNEDLFFWSAEQGKMYKTPAGTPTDFASIPWWAQSFVQVLGNNVRSAVQHDFHCTDAGKEANKVSQKVTDDLFREGLAVDNVRASKARLMYGGVTLFQKVKFFFKREKYG